jgi:hypothetical protein
MRRLRGIEFLAGHFGLLLLMAKMLGYRSENVVRIDERMRSRHHFCSLLELGVYRG